MNEIRVMLVDAVARRSQVSIEMDTTAIVSGIAEEYIPADVLSERIKIRTADGGAMYVPLSEIAVILRLN